MIESRRVESELRWRPSPLALAIVTCAGVALAVALIGSYWQLIAFAAPLVGVLCSIGWQRPVPKVHVHAEPGSQRCFESEQTRLSVWALAESEDVAVDVALTPVAEMRLDSSSWSRVKAMSRAPWAPARTRAERRTSSRAVGQSAPAGAIEQVAARQVQDDRHGLANSQSSPPIARAATTMRGSRRRAAASIENPNVTAPCRISENALLQAPNAMLAAMPPAP